MYLFAKSSSANYGNSGSAVMINVDDAGRTLNGVGLQSGRISEATVPKASGLCREQASQSVSKMAKALNANKVRKPS